MILDFSNLGFEIIVQDLNRVEKAGRIANRVVGVQKLYSYRKKTSNNNTWKSSSGNGGFLLIPILVSKK